MEENGENVDNYFQLHRLMYNVAPNIFRAHFRKLWRDYSAKEWFNGVECGHLFISGPGVKQYQNSQKIQMDLLSSGNILLWDLPLLFESIGSVSRQGAGGAQGTKHYSADFEQLKKIRNVLAHSGRTEVEQSDFNKYWNTAVKILYKFGLKEEDLEKGNSKPKQSDPTAGEHEPGMKELNLVDPVEKLKEEGNAWFKEGKWWKAIKLYSDAIATPNVAPDLLAALYSNRSASFISCGGEFLDKAKSDAKTSILLRPQWSKGYYRLGAVYEKKLKYGKAVKQYKIALKFNPADATCSNRLHHCSFMLEKVNRQEHLDPETIHCTEAEYLERTRKKMGPMALFLGDLMQVKLNVENNSEHICIEGEKHLFGFGGYKKDPAQAALLFAKAVEKGDALGMYRLGFMMMEGQGVKVDTAQALQLHLRAGSMDLDMETYPGSGVKTLRHGVKEAQHALGLYYAQGTVVKRDYDMASKWYLKALRNGYGYSALNLGVLHSEGQGRPKNLTKAVEFWKVSSLFGCVRAMDTLSKYYYSIGDMETGLNWYAFAQSHKSLDIELRGLYSNLALPSDFNPDQFEEEFDKELNENDNIKEFVTGHDFEFDPDGLNQRRQRRKSNLKIDPMDLTSTRKKFILDHRKMWNQLRDPRYNNKKARSAVAKLLPAVSPNLIGLQALTFQGMGKAVEDKVYEGYALRVKVVDEVVMMKAVILLAQDDEGNLGIVSIYNYPHKKETLDEIGYGCSFTIVNPYYKKANDGRWTVRVDDPNLIMKHPQMRTLEMCRYCTKTDYIPKDRVICRKCKRACYCSRVCRHKDAVELQHNFVCVKNIQRGIEQ